MFKKRWSCCSAWFAFKMEHCLYIPSVKFCVKAFIHITRSNFRSDAMTSNAFYQRDLISIRELELPDIATFLKTASAFKKKSPEPSLQNKIIASCFFEPSTRTRL